jgi:predicted DCC family thiol-disulfide oxidoreductase YuxK
MTSSSPDRSKRPVLIYDGRCGFCKIWVDYWRQLTGDQVEFAASQDVAEQYPEI